MPVTPINGQGKPERSSSADATVDRRVIALMEELRDQGFSFEGIAAVLMKQGLTLSAERVKEIYEEHQAHQRKK
jgi:hypothetical protein